MEECVEESVKSVELWLSIPLQNSDHCVSLSLSSLLGSVGESEAANEGYIVDVLAGELAPLRLWLRVAIEFLRKNRSNSFENILRLILNQDLDQLFTEQSAISERILIINALASSYTMIAFQAVEQETKQQFMQAAMKLFADADRISSTDPGTWVGKGIMYILEGNLDRALQRFEQFISVAKDRNPIAAKLGKAMVAYYKTEYKEALEIYQGILENHPTCPAIVRLGIGMCAYQLNDMDLSKEAFERVLQLDPENPHAALGMYAVLYWEAIQKESSMEKAL